jgi:hypothetical protein
MTKYHTHLLLLCFFPMWAYAQTGGKQSPVKATLCELYEHPEQYAGKMVVGARQRGR